MDAARANNWQPAVGFPVQVADDFGGPRPQWLAAQAARAQRCLKARLELAFEKGDKVYSFFDFSAAKVNKSGKVKVVVVPKPA